MILSLNLGYKTKTDKERERERECEGSLQTCLKQREGEFECMQCDHMLKIKSSTKFSKSSQNSFLL